MPSTLNRPVAVQHLSGEKAVWRQSPNCRRSIAGVLLRDGDEFSKRDESREWPCHYTTVGSNTDDFGRGSSRDTNGTFLRDSSRRRHSSHGDNNIVHRYALVASSGIWHHMGGHSLSYCNPPVVCICYTVANARTRQQRYCAGFPIRCTRSPSHFRQARTKDASQPRGDWRERHLDYGPTKNRPSPNHQTSPFAACRGGPVAKSGWHVSDREAVRRSRSPMSRGRDVSEAVAGTSIQTRSNYHLTR